MCTFRGATAFTETEALVRLGDHMVTPTMSVISGMEYTMSNHLVIL